MYKHWKKIFLAIAALFWSGCNDNSSSDNPSTGNELVACDLDYNWCPDDPSCTNTYYCEDETVCFQQTENKIITLDCRDKHDNKTIYTKDEFNSKYYVESERIHAEVESYHESSSSFAETNLSSNTEAVKPLINCYNDTALNDKGQSFDIISCDDGNKYLRDHSVYSEVPKEREKVPKDVQIFAPTPGSEKAANCTKGPRKCHDYKLRDENGNTVKNVGGCNYNTITCPAKP